MNYYDIIDMPTHYMLVEHVKNAIGKGWQPLGGVAIASTGPFGAPRYYQAITRTPLV